MAFAANMIASLKLNNRRKSVHNPFSKDKKEYSKGTPIQSKEYTQFEKDLLLKELKENRELEKKQHIYKIIISLGLTIIVISTIVSIIKLTFF
ncbi:MAG: hypothetical protein COB15_12490 [Flavobacteriales bacterium]|nr:MAG: hypothetical protein COB15_12490 [Flavobacteriales bacterium]